MSQEDNETVEPEGADDLPGGSAPGGAQTRPEAQEQGGAGSLGEAQSDDVAPASDPMVDEPSEGEKGGARAERDAAQGTPDTPATQARDGSGDAGADG
jgi:hypothetical protein